MKKIINKGIWSLPVFALGLAFSTTSAVFASPIAGVPQQSQDANAQPAATPQDPITQLNLSPEQRQQIRAIREENKEERETINRRLRETQKALNQALDAETPNESLIEQRVRERGEAETAFIRLRVQTEARIRRVLTPEQVNTLRVLRAQAQAARREQRLENRGNKGVNGRGLNQRNGMLPGARRNNQLRRPRP
jgi:Spy/CpxP family protein refolding chaperone